MARAGRAARRAGAGHRRGHRPGRRSIWHVPVTTSRRSTSTASCWRSCWRVPMDSSSRQSSPTPRSFALDRAIHVVHRADADDPAARRRARARGVSALRPRASAPGRGAGDRDRGSSSICSTPPTARRRSLPDVRELDGVVYSSQPTAVRAGRRRVRARAQPRDGGRRRAAEQSARRNQDRRARRGPARARGRGRRAAASRSCAASPNARSCRQRGRDPSCLSDRLRVCALYPELMNIYADRGNLLMLERRCRWRGIEFELTAATIGEPLDFRRADLYYIGGGQDRDQGLCASDLADSKRADAARRGRPRRGDPRRVRRLPAARSLLPARRRDAPGRRAASISGRFAPTARD